MGKQIQFYMEYELIVMVAQKALDLGCKIIKDDVANGIVTEADSTDIIASGFGWYYFHVPEAGKYSLKQSYGKDTVDHGYNASGITLIELMPSTIREEEKKLHWGRLFCITDYYDEDSNLIPRPDCVTKVYNALARYVRKITNYVEIDRITLRDGRECIRKEHISDKLWNMVENEGYKLI